MTAALDFDSTPWPGTLPAGTCFTTASEPWMQDALCKQVGPDLFYPESVGDTAGLNQAKRVCGLCDVRQECLQLALDNNEVHGVWGGLGPRERHRLRRGDTVAYAELRCVVCQSRLLGGRGRYCSDGCRQKFNRGGIKLCVVCGDRLHGHGRTTYCTDSCRRMATRRRAT